jgi:hypothetical protein
MNKAGKRILKSFLIPALGVSIPLIFSPIKSNAEVLERKVKHADRVYSVKIDKNRKEYSIEPFSESKETRKEILASALLENLAESLESKSKDLEKEIKDFIWDNPSRIYFKFSDRIIALKENLEIYKHFPQPEIRVENVWRKGNKLNLEFKLESQEYILDWYKNSSIVLLHERDVRLSRAVFDRIIALTPNKPTGFGNFKEHELKQSEEIEVTGMLNEAAVEKVISLIPKAKGMHNIMQICYQIENWLAKQERRNREKVIKNLKHNFRLIRYAQKYWASPRTKAVYEIGRNILLQFEGKPKTIYIFINVNTKLNPLKEGQRLREATQTKLQEIYDAPLLKLLLLKPEQVENRGSAGFIITSSQDMVKHIKSILKEYEYKKQLKKFSFEEKALEYQKLKNFDSQLWCYITFLNRIKNKELKDRIEDLPEYKKFKKEATTIRNAIPSLEEVINNLYHVKKIKSKKLESRIKENEFFRAGLEIAEKSIREDIKERLPQERGQIGINWHDEETEIYWNVKFEKPERIGKGESEQDNFEIDVKIVRTGKKKRILNVRYYINREDGNWEIGKKSQIQGTPPSMPEIRLKTNIIDFVGESIIINGEKAETLHSYFIDREYKPRGADDNMMQLEDGKPEYFICRFKGQDVYEPDFHGKKYMLKGKSPGSKIKVGFLGEVYLFLDEDFRKLIGDMDILWGFQTKSLAKNMRKLQYHPTNINGLYIDKIKFKKMYWINKIILLNDYDFLYYGSGCALADLDKFKGRTTSSLIDVSP